MTVRDIAWIHDAFDAFDHIIFLGELSARGVTARWMRHRKAKSTFVFGQCDFERSRVELSQVLRWHWVPEYVALSVLHHECCHVVYGDEHGGAFKLAEERYLHHTASEIWCSDGDNLDRLLAASPPPKEPA